MISIKSVKQSLQALVLLLALFVTGCSVFEGAKHESAENGAEPAGDYSHEHTLQLLDRGKEEKARAIIVDHLDAQPEDQRALGLLRQIEADPVEWLGRDHFIHVVKPGGSLAAIAGHYLERADRFFILARYNDIEVPAEVEIGHRLRIPTRYTDRPSASPSSTEQVEEVREEADGSDARQQGGEGREEGGKASRGGGDHTDGDESTPKAEPAYQKAVAALEKGERIRAMEHLETAIKRNPDHARARRERKRLQEKVAPELHRKAVLLYRNQELDPAIELWNQVLTIDPGFSRARGYRSRAIELRKRLERLDQ